MIVASVLRKVLWTLGYPKYTPDLGPYDVGAIQTRFPGSTACQIHYPASAASTNDEFYPYFRPKAVLGLADYSGQDPELLGFLSDKKHPSWMNADPFIDNDNTKNTKNKKFPIVLFSHGLGGCMEMYTQLCQQIASYGFVVIAMEHEDGSGAYAETKLGDSIYYKRPDDTPYSREKVINFRRPFLQQRVQETTSILDTILLHSSNHNNNMDDDDDSTTTTSKTKLLNNDILQRIFEMTDTSKGVALLGHSFGGASMIMTAQEYLSKKSSSSSKNTQPILSLSVLDPWAFSLEEDVLNKGITSIPLLSILSQAWLTNPETIKVDQFLNHCLHRPTNDNDNNGVTSLYVPHAVHASFADSVSWLPGFIVRKLRMRGEREKKYDTIQSVAHVCVQQLQSIMSGDSSGHIEDLSSLEIYNFQKNEIMTTTTTTTADVTTDDVKEETRTKVLVES